MDLTTDKFAKEIAASAASNMAVGVLTAAAGAVIILYPLTGAGVLTVAAGSALLAVGIGQMILAFTSQSAGSFLLSLLLGTLYGVTGLMVAAFPAAGVSSVTGILGLLLISEGLLELVTALGMPLLVNRRLWPVFSASCNFLLGVLIIAEWPGSSLRAMTTLAGIGLLINGIARLVVATGVRNDARAAAAKAA